MYARFFGLRQEPFSLAPDPRYLFMSRRHREALAHLLYGVSGGGGFVLLSGEIGAGKTTVCRCFLEQIPKRCNVAYVFNPKLTVTELLKTICEEFRIPTPEPRHGPATVKTLVDPLNDFLLKTHAVGQNNVLIIDEAQMLSVDVLEQLRLLTNLETSERKLLQIILIGQPELRTMLERPDLEQLAQRVIARFHLKALSEDETVQYIKHRLSVAGMTRPMPFDKKALARIHQIARGVPRRINLLCDRAMLGAYAHGKATIDPPIVERAAREVFGKAEPAGSRASRPGDLAPSARRRTSALSRLRPVPVATMAALLIALLAGAGYAGWRQWQGTDGAVASAASGASGAASTVATVATATATATSAPAAPASGAATSSAARTAATSPRAASGTGATAAASGATGAPATPTAAAATTAPAVAAATPPRPAASTAPPRTSASASAPSPLVPTAQTP